VIDRRGGGHGAVVSRAGLLSDETGLPAPEVRSSAHARLTRILDAEFDFVWQLLRRFGLAPADADDATQEVFVILARRLESVRAGRERAFLYGTARRVFANARRGFRRRREAAFEDIVDDAPEDPVQPDGLLEERRARAFLDDLLAKLPEGQRRVLVLAEIEGLTAPEIAELEGIPLGTAASRLRLARQAFQGLVASARDKNPFDTGTG
jgi:RNA polymerase sigma-70 factor (ECF subfamily)